MITAACTLCACEKELDFRYHDIAPINVIESYVSDEGMQAIITETTPVDEPMNTTRMTDAKVVISDIDNGKSWQLQPDSRGIYTCNETGIENHNYLIEVERDGKYFSASAVMLPPTRISSLSFSWIKMPYDYVAALEVSFEENPSKDGECYWVRIYRNGEPYRWSATDDRFADGKGTLSLVFRTSRRDISEEDENEVLREGDIVSAGVTPISHSMYEYLEALTSGNSNGPHVRRRPVPGILHCRQHIESIRCLRSRKYSVRQLNGLLCFLA